jgi:hypothetical protein
MASLRQKIVAAMWRQDDEALYRLAKCQCCCHEHTSDWCEARIWYGCRGQDTMTRAEIDSWQKHYESWRGMTREQFFVWPTDDEEYR